MVCRVLRTLIKTTTMNSPKSNSSRWMNIGILVIIALLGLNAWLFYDKYQNEKTIETQTEDIAEAEKLNMELEKQYYETLSQLEEMRSDNEEMNLLIDKQKEELRTQKDEIARMIRTTKDYSSIKSRLRDLEVQAEAYLAELDALREQNALLTEENVKLGEEKRSLEENLTQQVRQNEDLSAARTALTSEKAKLESQNVVLSAKVNKASVIPVTNIEVNGYKVNDSGKESRKRYADNIDRLKVCFDAGANDVAEPGNEVFYIRIISPLGQTIAMDDMGSGILTTAEGDEVRFTVTKSFDYNQQSVNTCLAWDPGITLEKGVYQVEVYNKGYLTGASTFKLR